MTSDESETTTPDGPAEFVVQLQTADTGIDQLTHRREQVPERETLAVATTEMKTWERDRTRMRARLDALTAVIEKSESDAEEISTHEARLNAQLKTVIAPREAEALMHEIDTLKSQRDVIETTELEALEEQADLDDTLTAHLGTEASHRDAMQAADDALAVVVAEIDVEIAQFTNDRNARRADLNDGLLAKYDRVRASSGVAVSELVGHRCAGCHLDLSAAEVDDVKDDAAANGGIADCPQCGRMLIL